MPGKSGENCRKSVWTFASSSTCNTLPRSIEGRSVWAHRPVESRKAKLARIPIRRRIDPACARSVPETELVFHMQMCGGVLMVAREINLFRLLIPHWKRVGIALLAVLGITAADVLQPWPLKI